MREAGLPKEEFDIFEVGAWEAGHHEPSGKIVVVFRYSDREPIAFGWGKGRITEAFSWGI